jgi:hypothetical protein
MFFDQINRIGRIGEIPDDRWDPVLLLEKDLPGSESRLSV